MRRIGLLREAWGVVAKPEKSGLRTNTYSKNRFPPWRSKHQGIIQEGFISSLTNVNFMSDFQIESLQIA